MVLICYKQVDNSVKIWWLVSFVIKLFVNNKKLPVSVLTEPPYVVKEQGYAGFLINVDIYFKGLPDNDAGKKVSFLSSCRCQARWKWLFLTWLRWLKWADVIMRRNRLTLFCSFLLERDLSKRFRLLLKFVHLSLIWIYQQKNGGKYELLCFHQKSFNCRSRQRKSRSNLIVFLVQLLQSRQIPPPPKKLVPIHPSNL